MARTEKEIRESNEQIDRALAYGPEKGLEWLRAAFHSHENTVADLRERIAELRAALLGALRGRRLTVGLARMCRVCRVCRTPEGEPGRGGFLYHYGDEYAHEQCVVTERAAPDPPESA